MLCCVKGGGGAAGVRPGPLPYAKASPQALVKFGGGRRLMVERRVDGGPDKITYCRAQKTLCPLLFFTPATTYPTTHHSVVARKSLIVTEFVPPESPVTYCSCRTHASACYCRVWVRKYLRFMSSSIIRPH